MKPHSDFEEFLQLLEDQEVEYVIVGGYAVAFHGYPRFTKDLDVFFFNHPDNIQRLRKALLRFGFEENSITEEILSHHGNIITFGLEPMRIDLMNEIDGVDFKEASENVTRGHYGSTSVPFIGKEALLKNKKATPRLRDQSDAEELERLGE